MQPRGARAVRWSAVLGRSLTTIITSDASIRINLHRSMTTELRRPALNMHGPTRTITPRFECRSANPSVVGADSLPCNRDGAGLVYNGNHVRGARLWRATNHDRKNNAVEEYAHRVERPNG